MDRRKFVLLPLLFALGCATKPLDRAEFVYCAPETFANCTIATCEPKDGGYACKCFLDTRYSATSEQSGCVMATKTTAQSRFHPVASYQLCSDTSTVSPLWGWCLGVPCTIEENGDVICHCTTPPAGVQRVPYVVVTSTYLPEGCKDAAPGEVWSSATPQDVLQITDFLTTHVQGIKKPVVIEP